MTTHLDWPVEIVERRGVRSSKLVVCFGKLVADEVHLLKGRIVPGGHVPAQRTLLAGGAPANVTTHLADRSLPARMTGWIGVDPVAQGLTAQLRDRGVRLACKFHGRSPKETVLVDDTGERALLTDDGVGTLEPDDVLPEWFEGAAVVHLDGYDLFPERFPDAVRRAAEIAHRLGAIVSIDMGAANRIEEFGVDAYLELLEAIAPHVMFTNAEEAQILRLNAQKSPWLPLLVTHRGSTSTIVSTRELRDVFEVPPARIVDSTGCGDAFAAGFLVSMSGGADIESAVTEAHGWAQQTALVLGSQPPPPTGH